MLKELKITIYTTEDCNKCKLLKQLLDSKHIEYRELDAITNRESIKDCWFMSAPIIKVETVVEWEDNPIMRFEDMQKFISYIDENWIGIEA